MDGHANMDTDPHSNYDGHCDQNRDHDVDRFGHVDTHEYGDESAGKRGYHRTGGGCHCERQRQH